jgi:hypothetical protein
VQFKKVPAEISFKLAGKIISRSDQALVNASYPMTSSSKFEISSLVKLVQKIAEIAILNILIYNYI